MARTNYADIYRTRYERRRNRRAMSQPKAQQRPMIVDARPDLVPKGMDVPEVREDMVTMAQAERHAGPQASRYRQFEGDTRTVQDMRAQGRPNFPFDNPYYKTQGTLGPVSGSTQQQRWGYAGTGNVLDDRQAEYDADPNAPGYHTSAPVLAGRAGPRIEPGTGLSRTRPFTATSYEASHRYYMQNLDQPGAAPQRTRPSAEAYERANEELQRKATERGTQQALEALKPFMARWSGQIAAATENEAKAYHRQGRKAASEARKEGYAWTWNEDEGRMDTSRHDARAEGRRLRKITGSRKIAARRGGSAVISARRGVSRGSRERQAPRQEWDPRQSEPIALSMPSEEIDSGAFVEGQRYIDQRFVPAARDPETDEPIPAHYESVRTIWQDGQMVDEPETPLSMEERAMRVREQNLTLRQKEQEFSVQKHGDLQRHRQAQRASQYEKYKRRLIEAGGSMAPEATEQWSGLYEQFLELSTEYDATKQRVSKWQAERDMLNASLDLNRQEEARLNTLNTLLNSMEPVLAQLQQDVIQSRTDLKAFEEEQIEAALSAQEGGDPNLRSGWEKRRETEGGGDAPPAEPPEDTSPAPGEGEEKTAGVPDAEFTTEDGKPATEIQIPLPNGKEHWISIEEYRELVEKHGRAQTHRILSLPDPPVVR